MTCRSLERVAVALECRSQSVIARRNRTRYPRESLKTGVTSPDSASGEEHALVSRGYRITVDDGRDSFFAICIEDPDRETAWLMSDTVRSLEEML